MSNENRNTKCIPDICRVERGLELADELFPGEMALRAMPAARQKFFEHAVSEGLAPADSGLS